MWLEKFSVAFIVYTKLDYVVNLLAMHAFNMLVDISALYQYSLVIYGKGSGFPVQRASYWPVELA